MSKKGWVRHGVQEEKEKDHTQQIEEHHQEALWVLQSCTHGRESNIVAERMAEDRPNKVPCGERRETASEHFETVI